MQIRAEPVHVGCEACSVGRSFTCNGTCVGSTVEIFAQNANI